MLEEQECDMLSCFLSKWSVPALILSADAYRRTIEQFGRKAN